MAPQTDIPVAANVLGTIGTVLWCVQLVPQIWTNWRTKNTEGLPASMMFLWALCGVPFGSYAIVQNFNIPLQIQPQIFMSLSTTSWIQILVYNNGFPVWRGVLVGLITCAIFGGVEAALIVTLKPLNDRGNDAPALVLGIIASILLAIGLVPPYLELWKRRGRVIGINWIFLFMDWSGSVFSLMALVAQNTFDILGGVLYICCAALELGIFASHIVWRIRTRKIRKAAKAEGKTFDDITAEHHAAGRPFEWTDRTIDPRLMPSWWVALLCGRPLPGAGDKGGDACVSGDEERGEARQPEASSFSAAASAAAFDEKAPVSHNGRGAGETGAASSACGADRVELVSVQPSSLSSARPPSPAELRDLEKER